MTVIIYKVTYGYRIKIKCNPCTLLQFYYQMKSKMQVNSIISVIY